MLLLWTGWPRSDGDTFSCLQFQKGRELHLDSFRKAGSEEKYRYVVGIDTGLTGLEIIE